ncbi:DUF308 domain-containing protein [Mitsuaria sp. 7]|uniref:DUF308 domain-containing protein n=1 Tax=Mitsuaria sp. 7 TaxID=1658665 RepID=UPI0007DD2E6E|nr:hypothetical protein [Mitsuaria sp. 7]ANH70346.1 membrane protein [Mitsuaria sp. 7]
MSKHTDTAVLQQDQWLKRYYFARALFSMLWVAAAFLVGTRSAVIAAALLVLYPAWDAAANWVDANASGGLQANRTQRINVWASGLTTIAVCLALTAGMNAVLGIFGLWAIASGLLQLGTALRRWKSQGAQWVMVLSGAQSALAGGFFIAQSQMPTTPSIANVAGYAGVGAVYFAISGVWLLVRQMRRRQAAT